MKETAMENEFKNRDFRLLAGFKEDLPYSLLFRTSQCEFFIDVSGNLNGSIFKCLKSKKNSIYFIS